MILIYELIKYAEVDIAFGLVTGLVVYNTIGSFPAMIFQRCFDASSIVSGRSISIVYNI